MVLTPWRPLCAGVPEGLPARRVVHTVSRLADLLVLLEQEPEARVVLERLTSMRRHGMTGEELRAAAQVLARTKATLEGVAFHLPLASGSHLGEVVHLVNDVVASELPTAHPVGEPPDAVRAGLAALVVRRLRGAAPDRDVTVAR